jgi:hypothetical protein
MIFFRSHKLILAACSPGLRKQLMETPDTLAIPDLTKEQVSQVLELVYKGRLEVPSDKHESFLQTARNLGILGLPKSGEEKSKAGEEKSKSGEEKSNNKGVESELPKKKFKKPDSLSDETTSVVKMKRRCDKEVSSVAEKKAKRKKSCDKLLSNCDEETSNGDEETANLEEVKSKRSKKKVELCGLESLPDEVLVKILSHLSTRDILQNVALVSKRFKSLSEDHGAHIIVSLDNSVKGAVRFLRKAISLLELHISYPANNLINVNLACREPAKGLLGEILLAITDHNFVKVVNVSNQCASVSEEKFVQLSKTKLFQSLIKLVLPIPARFRR